MIARAVRLILSLSCFAGGVVLGALAVRGASPWREEYGILGQKLRLFEVHKDEINVVFVGSSHVYRQIIPEVFDRTAAELGRPVRSFNFGMDGAFPPEDWYNSEQLLKLHPRLDWVFVEVSGYIPAHFDVPGLSQRVVNWHDAPRTLASLRALWPTFQPEKKWAKRVRKWRKTAAETWEKRDQFIGHLECFRRRSLNLGEGATALRRLMWGVETMNAPVGTLASHDAGYAAEEILAQPAELAKFEREVANRARAPIQRRLLPPDAQENLERILAMFRAAGARGVVFTAPAPLIIAYEPDATTPALSLDYNDMAKYPDLFRTENRQDVGHLNAAGARIFSRILAEEWVKGTP